MFCFLALNKHNNNNRRDDVHTQRVYQYLKCLYTAPGVFDLFCVSSTDDDDDDDVDDDDDDVDDEWRRRFDYVRVFVWTSRVRAFGLSFTRTSTRDYSYVLPWLSRTLGQKKQKKTVFKREERASSTSGH